MQSFLTISDQAVYDLMIYYWFWAFFATHISFPFFFFIVGGGNIGEMEWQLASSYQALAFT